MIEEEAFALINIKDFQIHIPEKFETEILTAYKNAYNVGGSQIPVVKKRKVISGFHNEYKFVSPSVRNLEFLGKESTGEYNINVYELLGDGEEMKVPYYILDENSRNKSALAFSLVF